MEPTTLSPRSSGWRRVCPVWPSWTAQDQKGAVWLVDGHLCVCVGGGCQLEGVGWGWLAFGVKVLDGCAEGQG